MAPYFGCVRSAPENHLHFNRLRIDYEPQRNCDRYGSLGGLVDEFNPDISHWLFHRHEKQPAN
jgi:hypothetical protein